MTSDPSSSKRGRLITPPANPNLMMCVSSTINNFEERIQRRVKLMPIQRRRSSLISATRVATSRMDPQGSNG
ncbi:hypothetical protein J6590_057698, partial [Homalodisca vitripennis]